MRTVIIGLSFLFLIASFESAAQDTTSLINTSWASLKTQLQRRSDIVGNLVNVLSKSPVVDKNQLNNSKLFAIEIFKLVDTLIIKDSVSISRVATKNKKLTQALSRALVTLEQDPKYRGSKAVMNILMELEGCENRIAVAKRDYNEACKKYNRTDLLFGSDQIDNTPKVIF